MKNLTNDELTLVLLSIGRIVNSLGALVDRENGRPQPDEVKEEAVEYPPNVIVFPSKGGTNTDSDI